jgi:hypothetical protein
MILVPPGGVLAFQKIQHFLPANFLARRFYQEGAAASGTDQGIDFLEQVFGQQDVGPFGGHVHSKCALSI